MSVVIYRGSKTESFLPHLRALPLPEPLYVYTEAVCTGPGVLVPPDLHCTLYCR